MKVLLYKLRFKGSVHFGDTGIDLENVQEYISSDTLFSALINAMSIYEGSKKVEMLIERFLHNPLPPFFITSLFVYNRDFYFLPRPLNELSLLDRLRESRVNELKDLKWKELKKLKWVEKSYFLRWLRQDIKEEEIEEMLNNQAFYKEAFVREIRPRVTLDRVTNQSSLYHCGYIHFRRDAGLYGLVAFRDDDFVERFKELILLLGETGLGGEKTYGCGRFEVEFKDPDRTFTEILNIQTEDYTLLSLYHPSEEEKEELADNLLYYETVRKRGWITSGRHALPLKRKSVGFIVEGSVLRKPFRGTLIDVTPDNPPAGILNHPVYRYGYAFIAPFKEAIC